MIAYAVFAAVVQAFWLTFAPIDSAAADHYGVSVGAIGWLAEIFPLLYVLLALPSGRLLDRSFRPALGGGVLLAAAGGVLRIVGPAFAWAMAGQALVALAQPLVVTAVAKVAGDYLPERERPAGIAVGASAGFVGMLAALVLGPTVGGGGEIDRLLLVEAVVGVVSAAALLWLLVRRAPRAEAGGELGVDRDLVRATWALPRIRRIAGLAFVGFGIFIGLTTWLQSLLDPAGISEGTAAALLVGMLVAGMVGCAAIPPRLSSDRSEQRFLRLAVGAAIVGPLLLALFGWVAGYAVVLAAMGFALLPALPVLLTAAERTVGVGAAGTVSAIVWLAGNLGGVVVALIVQALVGSPTAAFVAMAAIGCAAIPFAWSYAGREVMTPS